MSAQLESRRKRNKTESKSKSPQVKSQFSQHLIKHKKSKTKERVVECPPITTKKLNPKQIAPKKKNQFRATVPVETCFKYYIGVGNNEQLVKRVMERRSHWRETNDSSSMFVNFKWQQSERGYRYDRLILSQNYKQLVNHFEHHKEISNKQYLLKNLTTYCEKHKLNAFSITPLTFTLDFNDDNCDQNVNQFLKAYELFAPKKPTPKQMLDTKRRLRGYYSNGYIRDNSLQYTKIQVGPTFVAPESPYLWLLKPTFLNRGRGIHVFDNLETLVKLIEEYQQGYIEQMPGQKESDDEAIPMLQSTPVQSGPLPVQSTPPPVQSTPLTKKVDPNTYIRQQPTGPSIIKANAFVVQKYIERPALINKRKFDIRVWGLVTHELDVLFFSEGYVRTSSEDFSYDVDNRFVHLTNNAVQKFSINYGQFEAGNQLSFQAYQEYLTAQNVMVTVASMVEKMKERIWMVMSSIKSKINFEDRKFCFEIFGFDFILDDAHDVWLIEVNTNPCIEESSPLLATIIPRMLDDAFKLTVDLLFPGQSQLKQSLPQLQQMPRIREECPSEYPVKGYSNDENMWQLLGSLTDRFKKKKK